MASLVKSSSAARSIRKHILWSFLLASARLKGIHPDSLSRVREYVENKFSARSVDPRNGRLSRTALFPGLSREPIYSASQFHWTERLESNADDIRREFLSLRQQGLLKPHPQRLANSGSWNTYYFFSNGRQFDEHCRSCPVTAATIKQVDGGDAAGQAYFSVMSPGTHIKAHCGPTNTRIRCHLGLIIPDTSLIRIETTRLSWRELGCIVFDDSFEHEVWNPDAERSVLIIDAWHPDLSPVERWALATLTRYSSNNMRYRRGMLAKQ